MDTRGTMRIRFETATCKRCGGSGSYSYCQKHGTTCFGCNGTGSQVTPAGKRAGAAVRRFMAERYSVRVEDLRAGMQFRPYDASGWVIAAEDARESSSRFQRDGEWIHYVDVPTCRASYGLFPGQRVPVRPTPQQFRDEVVPFARRYKGALIEED